MFDCVLNTSGFRCKQSLFWWGNNILDTHEALRNGTDVVNVEKGQKIRVLVLPRIKAVKYFELLGMRYGDTNAVVQRF